jgi:hypothetical protein
MQTSLSKELELLMLGCGFNFYRVENQLRADDLLVRQKAGSFFGHTSARLEKLAEEYQHTVIPAPTRQQPYPPAELMERLNAIRALRQRVQNQGSFLQGLSAPTQDKIWRRLRDEQGLLSSLLQADLAMLQLAADIEKQVQSLSVNFWNSPDSATSLNAILDRWDVAVRARQDLLQIQAYQ